MIANPEPSMPARLGSRSVGGSRTLETTPAAPGDRHASTAGVDGEPSTGWMFAAAQDVHEGDVEDGHENGRIPLPG